MRKELAETDWRIARWQESFESGDMPASLGADRLQELMQQKAKLADTLGKAVPIRPPAYLYTAANIERFQSSLKDLFLSSDNPMTRNYLRFLVEGITVTDEEIDISARTDAALRLMAGRGEAVPETKKAEGVTPSLSPTEGFIWLRQTGSTTACANSTQWICIAGVTERRRGPACWR